MTIVDGNTGRIRLYDHSRYYDVARGLGRTLGRRFANAAEAKQHVRALIARMGFSGLVEEEFKFSQNERLASGKIRSGEIRAHFAPRVNGLPFLGHYGCASVILDPQDGTVLSYNAGLPVPPVASAQGLLDRDALVARVGRNEAARSAMRTANPRLGYYVPKGSATAVPCWSFRFAKSQVYYHARTGQEGGRTLYR